MTLGVHSQWPTMPLSRAVIEMCDGPFGSSLASSHYRSDGPRVIRLGNIGQAIFRDDDEARISEEHFAALRRHEVRAGDLLVAGLGDDNNPLGRACVAPEGLGPAIVKADCFRFRLDPSILEPRYVAWALSSTVGQFAALGVSRGSTRLRANLGGIASIRLSRPPAAEQSAIVDFLNVETARIDALVAARKRQVEVLREREAAVRDRAIADAGVPVRLAHAVRAIEQGWSPECEARTPGPSEWGVLKAGATNHSVFREEESKALPPFLAPRAELEVAPGDVLMSRANTRELAGSAAFVDKCRPRLMFSDKHYRVVPDRSTLHPRYLALILQSAQARARIQAETVGSSASMQNISQDLVRDLRLPIPFLDAQVRIVSVCSQASAVTRAAAAAIDRQVALLGERRQALITAAVTGELRVPGMTTTNAAA